MAEGSRPEGKSVLVPFGDRRVIRDIPYPFTPDQLDKIYAVAIYGDAEGNRRLGGFTIADAEY